MADESDFANDSMEESLQRSIQNIRDKVNESEESEHYCVDCDNEIPEARRVALKGVIRCQPCQESFEKKVKHYR